MDRSEGELDAMLDMEQDTPANGKMQAIPQAGAGGTKIVALVLT
jgi:hypothetical protein